MKIAVFFGGKSVEHEVSVISGIQLCKTLELEYEVIPIYITKNNKFYYDTNLYETDFYIENNFKRKHFLSLEKDKKPYLKYVTFPFKRIEFDLAILCVHGSGVEDGTLASLFDFYDIPYVASNKISSCIAQNKYYCKRILEAFNVNVINYEIIRKDSYNDDILLKIERLSYPLILKANNLGSSIGIEVVNNFDELKKGLEYIFKYDQEVIVEKYIKNKKEYNIALFKNNNKVETSMIEEVKGDTILSYDDKYINKKQARICPADIKNSLKNKIEYNAKKIYYGLNFNSIIRIDFIYDEESNLLYFNEVNSIPGSYANYLFKDRYSFLDLLKNLIDQAFLDHDKKQKLIRTIDNNQIYEVKNGIKFK